MAVFRRGGGVAAMLLACSGAWAGEPAKGPAGLQERMEALLEAFSGEDAQAQDELLGGLFDRRGLSSPKLRKVNLDDEWGGPTGRPPEMPRFEFPRQDPPRRDPPRQDPPREDPPRREPPLQRPPERREPPPPRREPPPPPPTRRPA